MNHFKAIPFDIFFRKAERILQFLLILVLTGVLYNQSLPAKERSIRVGVYDNNPLIFMNKQGKAWGLFADIINHIGEEEGWDIDYVHGTWPEKLTRLKEKKIDILAVIAFSHEREILYDFSDENVLTNWGQVFSSEDGRINNITDLSGKKIAVLKKDIHNKVLQETLNKFDIKSSLLEVNSYREVLQAVSDKIVQAGVVNRFYGMRFGDKYNVIKSGIIFNPIKIHFAFPKNHDAELRHIVDKHLVALKKSENSVYYKSLSRWLGATMIGEQTSPYLISIFTVLFTMMVGFSGYFLVQIPKVRRMMGMTELVESRAVTNVLLTTGLFAGCLWLIDSITGYLWFNERGHTVVTILGVHHHAQEMFTRLIFIGAVLLGGIIISRVLARLVSEQYNSQQNAENLSTILDSIGDAVIATDKKGIITLVNPVAEDLIGWKFQNVEGKPLGNFFNIINNKTREKAISPVDLVLKSKKIVNMAYHTVLIAKNGTEYLIADSAAPIHDADRNIIGVVLVFRDVTDQYILQEKLVASEEKFRTLFEASQDAILLLDSVEGYLDCNPAALKMFAVPSRQEFLSLTPPDLSPEHQPNAELSSVLAKKEIKKALEEGSKYFEWWHKGLDGREFPTTVLLTRIEIGCKTILQKTIRDITDRTAAENLLRKSEERFRLLFERSQDAIFMVELKTGRYLDANAATERLTGRSVSELKKLTTDQITPYRAQERLQLSSNAEVSMNLGEVVYIKPDKSERIARLSIVPLNGQIVFGIAHDITELKKTQKLMIQTEKIMSIGGLAAGMAHEINNPLAAISQGIQNLERRLSPDFKKNIQFALKHDIDLNNLQAYLQERNILNNLKGIKESCTRAANTVSSMLQFSRKSESKQALTNLMTLVENVLDLAGKDFNLKKHYDFKDIKVVKRFASNIPLVPCVETEIEQVILNLFNNAAWAMVKTKGANAPQITLDIKVEKEMIKIEVEDNGPGMDQEIKKQIFEPFFTTKPAGEGTGLGLSVSYMIVTNNHQGTMEVESELGMGTKFIIRLPLKREITL